MVKRLLQDGRIDPNVTGNTGDTPLRIACDLGDVRSVELLLQDRRVNFIYDQQHRWNPLHSACYCNNLIILKMLLASWSSIDLSVRVSLANGEFTAAELSNAEQFATGRQLLAEYEQDPLRTMQRLRRELGTFFP